MNKLRELREEKGYSLRELGNLLDMNASVLGNYERGDRQPKIEVWEKLAEFFEVTPAYIMGWSTIKEPENFFSVDRAALTEENKKTLDEINSLVKHLISTNNGWAAIQTQEIFKSLNVIIGWSDVLDGDFSPVDILASFSFLIKELSLGEYSDPKKAEEYFLNREKALKYLDKLYLKRLKK